MTARRLGWEELPDDTRREIERRAGLVINARIIQAGRNCTIALVLTTPSGPVFAKGLHHSSPRLWTQNMEELINPYVRHLSPALLWRIRGEWDILGFAHINGHHADFTPGSPDVTKVTETFTLLGATSCPDLPLKSPAHRWKTYLDNPADLGWLDGDQLLHIDPTPSNLLIVDNRAMLVDWAWPTRGAGWIDPACLVIRLIEAGHTPEQAETLVAHIRAWADAPAEGLAAFARANAAMWTQVAAGRPFGIARAAETWAKYRTALMAG